MAETTVAAKAPWHHWPVALLAIVFYAAGAVDYTLTKLSVGFYVASRPEAQVAFAQGLAIWLDAVWAVCVWGGLLGAWLLLRRNRWCVLLLFVSTAALVLLAVWLSLFTRPTLIGVAGLSGVYTIAGSAAIALLFYLYARWERTEQKLA